MKIYEDKDSKATIYVGKLKEVRERIRLNKIHYLINNKHLEDKNVIKMYDD
tara:strand:+ start:716 stop:868 length:153 start_codon:yes stop_codon:yes gene_type:complete